MVPKKERLKRDDFTRFFSFGRRVQGTHITLVWTPNKTFHASVVVPKRVAKTAVLRNKLRRRIYETLRLAHISGDISGVCIVLVKPSIKEATTGQLRDDIHTLLGRIMKAG